MALACSSEEAHWCMAAILAGGCSYHNRQWKMAFSTYGCTMSCMYIWDSILCLILHFCCTWIWHNENRHKSSGGHRTSRSRTCSAPFSSSTLSWRCSTPADRCSTSVTDWLAVDSVSSFTWDRSCVICLSCSHTCFCSSSLSCISSYQQMTQPFTIREWQWRRKVVHVDNH